MRIGSKTTAVRILAMEGGILASKGVRVGGGGGFFTIGDRCLNQISGSLQLAAS